MKKISLKDEINQVFLDYLKSYLSDRDFSATFKMFSPNITGFGTGFDEKGHNLEETIRLYKRDFSEAPNTIDYELKNLNIQIPFDNTAIITCELDMNTFILNHSLKFNNLRFSSIWTRHNEKWLMEHFHISFPTNLHGKGEAYPLKEIEEQNIVLQKFLNERTNELNIALEKMKRIAITDKLTQIYNRIKIEECLDTEINRAQRYDYIFSIIIIDIDYFKKVNDKYGHLIGDKVLIEFTDLISKRIRKTDIFGRWGGEEFILICPYTDLEEAYKLTQDLQEVIRNYHFKFIGQMTASFGISTYRKSDSADNLIKRADDALYKAKQNGRDRIYTEEINSI